MHADHLEMGRLQALTIERVAQTAHHVQQQIVDGERLLRLEFYAGVEPAHFGFALGVDVVIDIQDLAAECTILIQEFDEGFKALSGFGGGGATAAFQYALCSQGQLSRLPRQGSARQCD